MPPIVRKVIDFLRTHPGLVRKAIDALRRRRGGPPA